MNKGGYQKIWLYHIWFLVAKLGCTKNTILKIFLNWNKNVFLLWAPSHQAGKKNSDFIIQEISHTSAPYPISSPKLSKSWESYKRIHTLGKVFWSWLLLQVSTYYMQVSTYYFPWRHIQSLQILQFCCCLESEKLWRQLESPDWELRLPGDPTQTFP